MAVPKNPLDPFAVDGSGIDSPPDDGILFPDHSAFQFDGAVQFDSAPATDWSDVGIDIRFVDDTLIFDDTTPDLSGPPAQQELASSQTQTTAQDDPRTYWTLLDELSALYPGAVWPPMSEWASLITGSSAPSASTPSQEDGGVAGGQNITRTGLDWELTPDYDDDPGWYPGWIPSFDQTAPRTDDGIASPSAVITNVDEPRDETVTSSLTLTELNEQYPGIVWPANWWLL
jgi:hypothetical protein